MTVKLRESDLDTLRHARWLQRTFDAGIFPRGSGQHAHFRRLERLGLLRFDAWGRDIDRVVDEDVPIFRLTVEGLAAIGAPIT